ncbi:MAG: methionyl-tRNA formyltransferase [candidate division WS6 bacterium 36_33]|uniref:Methionyl-tRNA formyltransferase n=1 Tax=candidate division WS6 bacterium 36_33 TaxID=1641388 RepID=A0A101GYJ0_9BACT|nr:MAG: methionyl-tRNA formyltransferase [candidate division WS6 bacterium 36_33]
MRTIFLGTAWESLETLKVLHEDSFFDVVCVITTPDKPVGRKQKLTPSEVKKYALEHDIPVVHTEKKKENYIKVLEKYKPEIVVCKAFGEIVPKEFLDYPKYGCINIHFSILPKYRGAVPIQKAILDGEEETGISIMLMSEGLDEGDILKIFKEKIREDDTNITLRERLVKKTTEVLIPTLRDWVAGDITSVKQKNDEATYCWQKDISKENAQINWKMQTPKQIERMVRAFIPWPIAWTILPSNLNKNMAGKIIKIFRAELVKVPSEKDPGEIFANDGKVLFATKDPLVSLRTLEFQIEGRNKTNERDFLNGIGRDI